MRFSVTPRDPAGVAYPGRYPCNRLHGYLPAPDLNCGQPQRWPPYMRGDSDPALPKCSAASAKMELSARSSCRLLLLLVLAAACSTQRSPIEEAGVLRLTDSDYAATLADKPLLVVNYCARWSRSCKLLADEYHATARLLARRGHTGILAELDASEEVRSAQQARIGSYPAIKLFRKGQLVDTFAGDHTADALTSYVEK